MNNNPKRIHFFPLNARDYRALIGLCEDQEDPLRESERIAYEKLKKIVERIDNARKRAAA